MSLVDLRDPSSFPTRRVEAWKYTDLRRFLRETPPASDPAQVAPGGPFAALGGAETAIVNGRGDAAITVTENEQVARLRFVSTQAGAGHQATVTVDVARGASLVLLESHEGSANYVSNVALNIKVAEGGQLTRIVLADDAADAIALSRAEVRLGQGAAFSQTLLTTGARLQRLETHVAHPGDGATVGMDGLYLLSGERHADLTSVVTHDGRDGVTSQLAKGVVRDAARGVFQGKIVVERGADGTDARMGHHALILGERAEVDAKPELEIFADDVQCAHGATVADIQKTHLYYLMSRGIPEKKARALLINGFVAEIVEELEDEALVEALDALITDWLEHHG